MTSMTQPLQWRRTRDSLYLLLISVLGGLAIFPRALDKSVPSGEHQVFLGLAIFMAIALAIGLPSTAWQMFQARGQPGARLEATRLLVWPLRRGDPVVIELADVAGIDWTYQGTVALRMRSGEVRSVQLWLSKRNQEEALAALRQALAR